MILLEDEQARESANQEHLKALLTLEDVQWDIREATGEIEDRVAAEAGLADLIVVNRKLDDSCGPDMVRIASSLCLKAHKPLVAVAEDCTGFEVAGGAVVAWDGSGPSMSALTAAVPLLKLAETVLILQVLEEGDTPSAQEAAQYLSRHGIHATVREEDAGKHDPAILIQRTCSDRGTGYCVMGAYGRSRLREAILGGVTRRMLTSSLVPLVIAH